MTKILVRPNPGLAESLLLWFDDPLTTKAVRKILKKDSHQTAVKRLFTHAARKSSITRRHHKKAEAAADFIVGRHYIAERLA